MGCFQILAITIKAAINIVEHVVLWCARASFETMPKSGLGDIDRYADRLKSGGVMLLSGFYEEDIPMITAEAAKYGLKEERRLVSAGRWTALKLRKD